MLKMKKVFFNKNVLSLTGVMVLVSFVIAGISILMIYHNARQQLYKRLTDIVNQEESEMEVWINHFHTNESDIIKLINRERENNNSIGRNGEIVIARRSNDSIEFLVSNKSYNNYLKISENIPLASPMHKALIGEKGFLKGKDYDGVEVFAAYAYIKQLNWGIVAKIPVSEIDGPYILSALLVLILAVIFVSVSSYAFFKITNPLLESVIESEKKLQRALMVAPFPIMIHAEDGEVISINKAWTELTGYSLSDIPTISDWTKKAYRQRSQNINEYIDKLYSMDYKAEDGEYEIYTAAGKKITWDFGSSALGKFTDGRRLVISMAKDITERKLIEAELYKNQHQLKVKNEEYLAANEELNERNTEYAKINEELIQAKELAEESAYFLNESQKAGFIGSYNANFIKDYWQSSETLDKIFGIDKNYDRRISGWFNIVHPEDRNMMNDYLVNEVIPNQKNFEKEYRITRINDNLTRWVYGLGNTRFDEKGNITEMYGTIQDITDHKLAEIEIKILNEELEQRVIERTSQLEMANKELEAFSYSVSHDLRAPLRALDGFARILIEDYSASLDPEANRLLHVITDNAKKMGILIDDLLSFSRLGRQEIRVSEIGMHEMANSVFNEIVPVADKDKIEFRLQNIPGAYGDPAMIRQVWANLISNAIKFTAQKKSRIIEIGSHTEDGTNEYFVKDNGVGFNMTYKNKLFGVFQRLHSSEEFEGTGVGLALVQRIIHRLNGAVWAEAKLNEGATFYFSLPNRIK
jgi:PAS domain S-box-containing protein